MKFQDLKNDLFKKFENDEITNLNNLRGGLVQENIGTSSGVIHGESWCASDTGNTKTQEIYMYWNCVPL
jgi:hypothetical protein